MDDVEIKIENIIKAISGNVSGIKAIEIFNPEIFPHAIKPIKYYQINFNDGDSLLLPIFVNVRVDRVKQTR